MSGLNRLIWTSKLCCRAAWMQSSNVMTRRGEEPDSAPRAVAPMINEIKKPRMSCIGAGDCCIRAGSSIKRRSFMTQNFRMKLQSLLYHPAVAQPDDAMAAGGVGFG